MDNKNPESIHIALGKKAQLNLKQKIQAYLECRICNCCPLEQPWILEEATKYFT